jgi:hypothetical protein
MPGQEQRPETGVARTISTIDEPVFSTDFPDTELPPLPREIESADIEPCSVESILAMRRSRSLRTAAMVSVTRRRRQRLQREGTRPPVTTHLDACAQRRVCASPRGPLTLLSWAAAAGNPPYPTSHKSHARHTRSRGLTRRSPSMRSDAIVSDVIVRWQELRHVHTQPHASLQRAR